MLARVHTVDVSLSQALHHYPLQGQSLLGYGACDVAELLQTFLGIVLESLLLLCSIQVWWGRNTISSWPSTNILAYMGCKRLNYSSVSVCCNRSHISGFNAVCFQNKCCQLVILPVSNHQHAVMGMRMFNWLRERGYLLLSAALNVCQCQVLFKSSILIHNKSMDYSSPTKRLLSAG